MEVKKNIKIVTSLQNSDSSANLKNIQGATTFKSLKSLAKALILDKDEETQLFFNNREIDVNNEESTIDEVFCDQLDIIIEIRTKPASSPMTEYSQQGRYTVGAKVIKNDTPNKSLLNTFSGSFGKKLVSNTIYSNCENHPKEHSKIYCETCKISICFRCSILNAHKNHTMFDKTAFYDQKITVLTEKFEIIKDEISNNGVIKKIEYIKKDHINNIKTDFDLIIEKVKGLRDLYINFYEDFYKSVESHIQSLNYETTNIQNSFKEIEKKNILKNNIFNDNLTKINNLESHLGNVMKNYKKFNEFVNIRKDYDSDYENNIGVVLNNLESVKSEYIQEKKLKELEKYSISLSDEIVIQNYFCDFYIGYGKPQNQIHMPIPNTKKLITYDNTTKNFAQKLVTNEKLPYFHFNEYNKYLISKDYLLVTGGVDQEKEVANCYLYNVKESRLLQINSLNRSKSQHALFFASKKNTNLIFAISGNNNPTVEIYNLKKNYWSKFKNLNKIRCNSNVIFVDKYLYIFAGSDGDKYLGNSFERIEIDELFENYDRYEQNDFEDYMNFYLGTFTYKERDIINLNFSGFGMVQILYNKFLILGGFNIENDKETNDEIRLFDYISTTNGAYSFRVSDYRKKLPTSCCFYNQEFINLEDHKAGQFTASGNLLIIDKNSGEFQVFNHKLNY